MTREMIEAGFRNGIISIEDEYDGCISLCCRIGENSFYFASSEDADLAVAEYWKTYTLDETIDMLFDILRTVESAEKYGLDDGEYEYYKTVLAV